MIDKNSTNRVEDLADEAFTDESMRRKRGNVGSTLEPKMLPSNFRERSTNVQRIYIFAFVLLYSIAIGVITFTLMAGLSTKINDIFQENANFLLIMTIISIISLFTGAASPLWSKNRKYLFTWWEFAILTTSPIVYIIAYSYLSVRLEAEDYIREPKKLLLIMGLIIAISNVVPIILNVTKTIINIHRFKASLVKALMMMPGNLAVASGGLALWGLAKWEGLVISISSISIIVVASIVAGGLFLLLFGGVLSMKWDVKGTRSIWKDVQFIGALPALVIFSALLAIGSRFAKAEFEMPVVMVLVIDVLLLGAFSFFAWIKGRIKNLIRTRPIYNNIIIKAFVIAISLVGLMAVVFMRQMAFLKNYGPSSFEILTITSVTVIIGVFVAHITKIITFTKLFNVSVVGAFATLILVVSSVMTIIMLENADVILAIISRQIVSLFLTFAIVVEVIILFVDVLVTTLIVYKKDKEEEGLRSSSAKAQNASLGRKK